MSGTTETQQPVAWKMPEIELGDTVHYFAHEGAEPVMAFVTKVGRDTLTLWALSPGYGGVEKPSVRYGKDPRLNDSSEWKKFGTWLPKPRDPRFAQVSERIALLERRLGDTKK